MTSNFAHVKMARISITILYLFSSSKNLNFQNSFTTRIHQKVPTGFLGKLGLFVLFATSVTLQKNKIVFLILISGMLLILSATASESIIDSVVTMPFRCSTVCESVAGSLSHNINRSIISALVSGFHK